MQTLIPGHPWVSMLKFPEPRDHPVGGPFSEGASESGSLYHPSRGYYPSELAVEYQPNSAYSGVEHFGASGAGVPAAPQSLYSVLAEPTAPATKEHTHPAQQGGAVPGARPEELELVRPLKDPSR
jgi:hypothetical protein